MMCFSTPNISCVHIIVCLLLIQLVSVFAQPVYKIVDSLVRVTVVTAVADLKGAAAFVSVCNDLVVIALHGKVTIARHGVTAVVKVYVPQAAAQVGKIVVHRFSGIGHLVHVHHSYDRGGTDLIQHRGQVLAGDQYVGGGDL